MLFETKLFEEDFLYFYWVYTQTFNSLCLWFPPTYTHFVSNLLTNTMQCADVRANSDIVWSVILPIMFAMIVTYSVSVVLRWLRHIQWVCFCDDCDIFSECGFVMIVTYSMSVVLWWLWHIQWVWFFDDCDLFSECGFAIIVTYTVSVVLRWLRHIQWVWFCVIVTYSVSVVLPWLWHIQWVWFCDDCDIFSECGLAWRMVNAWQATVCLKETPL